MKINENGYWEGVDVIQRHYFDQTLFKSIDAFCAYKDIKTIIDLGCGRGDYVREFRRKEYYIEGYDGNPDTIELTNGLCTVLQLHKDVTPKFKTKFDLVLSLEVGEHIPKKYEDIFIDNITTLTNKFLIVSWAIPNQGGDGHVNCQKNDYIKTRICEKGFINLVNWEKIFRNNVEFSWFKDTIMVFEKIKQ